jgi:hypothetical protein
MFKLGSKGDGVAIVQRALNTALPSAIALVVDGIFGPLTRDRTVLFQKGTKRLVPDGVAGPLTLGELFQGVELTLKVTAKRKNAAAAPPADAPLRTGVRSVFDRPNLLPGRLTPPSLPNLGFVPWTNDPRDFAWHEANRKWLEWLAKPFPKGPAPALPPLLPPSLRPLPLPPPPLWPSYTVPPDYSAPQWSSPIQITGGSFELSAGFKSKIKDGKLVTEAQEAEAKLTFLKIPLLERKTIEAGIEASVSTKGNLDVEIKAEWKPVKWEILKGGTFNITAMPLIATAANTGGFEAFAGGKLVVQTFIQPWGVEVEAGGKFGPKLNAKIDEDGRFGASAYPLSGMGTLEFRWGARK